ncbi:MAG: response regulator transcription factor [Candidatus Falkowbacteria bacterium]
MRLLIIEDNLKIAQKVANFLKTLNYNVDMANDGESGLNLALGSHYDLIISDYILPKINGQEIVTCLRKNKINTPILMLSVLNTSQDKTTLLETGADDYLVKPFSFSELMARIKALLRRCSEIKPQQLSIADLTLDLSSQEATRCRRQIYLTTKEFGLLKMLMEHPGTTYSKDLITEKVWDDASCHLSNIIETHIRHLRRKVDFKKPFLIQTVTGRGYRINLNS